MLREFQRKEDGLSKEQRRERISALRDKLTDQQLRVRDAKLPIIVLVEGWSASGKGSLINDLIRDMDPRFFKMLSSPQTGEEQERYPFLYKFFSPLPANGNFLFVDSGWMEETVTRYIGGEIDEEEYLRRIESCAVFERQLRDNGYVVIKLFLHISREEQQKRLSELQSDRDTAWRVSESDLFQQREYKNFRREFDRFMEQNSKSFPWHVIDAHSWKKKLYDAFLTITDGVEQALEQGRYVGRCQKELPDAAQARTFEECDLSLSVSDEEYRRELKKLKKKLTELHNKIYRAKIPVVICYEGWDAAGKGGNIRRLAAPLDPRGFDVIPIAAPTSEELARHYLWRFWTKLPRTGHVTIFDRTWYGRVMVERIEGFCAEDDWRRAYQEINEFEKELSDWGAVVLKFWIQIDPDTQLERFELRQNTPSKQWKITDEDWRNREKWPQYEEAVAEMLRKTSTDYAPWHVIPSVDKKYARLATLRIVVDAMEKALEAKADDTKQTEKGGDPE